MLINVKYLLRKHINCNSKYLFVHLKLTMNYTLRLAF